MRKLHVYIILAVVGLEGSVARAQSSAVPGRDLFLYPIGLVAEAGALPDMLGAGLFSPATTELPAGATWRLSAATMTTPSDLAASAELGAVSHSFRGATITFSFARAGVDGLVRTENDPLTLDTDVEYSSIVASLGASRRLSPNLVVGVAARLRSGQMDVQHGSAFGLDLGVLADHLTKLDGRIGVATFLLEPWARAQEPATVSAAADLRVIGADSGRTLRAGFSMTSTSDRGAEQFAFVSGRYGAWEVRGGPVRTAAYGSDNYRARIAVAIHYGGYTVGLSREGTPNGFPPSYQFILSSTLP